MDIRILEVIKKSLENGKTVSNDGAGWVEGCYRITKIKNNVEIVRCRRSKKNKIHNMDFEEFIKEIETFDLTTTDFINILNLVIG